MRDLHSELLTDIEGYLQRTGMAESSFGMKITGDTAFLQRLRQGVSPTLRTETKIRRLIGKDRDSAATEIDVVSTARRARRNRNC